MPVKGGDVRRLHLFDEARVCVEYSLISQGVKNCKGREQGKLDHRKRRKKINTVYILPSPSPTSTPQCTPTSNLSRYSHEDDQHSKESEKIRRTHTRKKRRYRTLTEFSLGSRGVPRRIGDKSRFGMRSLWTLETKLFVLVDIKG